MIPLFLTIFIHSLLAVSLGWIYFRRYAIKRPPIGVFNLWDIALMMGGILLIPYLYLALPVWLVTGLLSLAAVSVLYFMFEPIFARWLPVWSVILLLTLGTLAIYNQFGFHSRQFFAVNNVVQVLVVVGITNLWAQSGMKARDVTILGVALIVYDYTFTTLLPLMDNLFIQLDGLPFAPMVGWPLENGQYGAIGLGDLLLATVFPLVMRKAYGVRAGITALGLVLVAIVGVMWLLISGLWTASFPVMIVLGPLMVAQYLYRRWQAGPERTTHRYLQAEPIHTAFLFQNSSPG